ncbi:MAG: CoA transferase [Oscillospiraceae bacterium]|nr:CoA transferase [Oscillospiraceae bacterium]
MENNQLPLDGIRIVEMGTHVAIPSAARIMADFGAEVIKVEAPRGDGWRYPGPEFNMPAEDEENPMFAMQNANKHLMCINIKNPGGLEVLEKLISTADVFMTSVRSSSLKRSGLDYESLHARYPGLIYCQNTGYGSQGAEAGRPGFDQAAFWARTGALRDWVEEGDAPLKPSVAFGDLATGAQLLSGILIALLGRRRTGRGTMVTTSLLNCGVWYNSNAIVSAQPGYDNPYPEDRSNPHNPFTGFYRASDGEWFTTVVFIDSSGEEGLYRKMFPLLGIEDWLQELNDGTFSHTGREITARIHAEIGKRPSAEWFRRFDEGNIIYERCAHLKDISQDPQAWAAGCFEEVVFPNGQRRVLVRSPVELSAYGKRPMQAMGPIGADTWETLLREGWSAGEIDHLLEAGAIVSPKEHP